MGIINARNISRSFGSTKAVRDICFTVKEGEIVAVMGPSGSGKTTLLHSLAVISPIDTGEIIFNGRRIDKLNDNERSQLRRQEFGFIFQLNHLVPELTALDNVALPLLLNGSRRSAAYDEAKRWLEIVDMSKQSTSLPGELSGGQAQRIAIARAMITQPKIIFADEPTGSLDSYNSKKVMELFISTAKESLTTVVIVTHEPSIARYADRTVVVRDGLIADGTV